MAIGIKVNGIALVLSRRKLYSYVLRIFLSLRLDDQPHNYGLLQIFVKGYQLNINPFAKLSLTKGSFPILARLSGNSLN